MPQIGPLEILVCALVALLVFGPDKLPGMARSVGRTLSDLRRVTGEVRREFTTGMQDESPGPEGGRGAIQKPFVGETAPAPAPAAAPSAAVEPDGGQVS